jgi:frataxin-like iron-binding protein CyaY
MSALRLAFVLLLSVLLLTGCLTDAATRLAYDIEAGAARVGAENGAHYIVEHRTPSRRTECRGPYTVQLDKAGALIIWCRAADGQTVVSSPGTTYHRRFVDTPRTWILEKGAGETLLIRLERQHGRVVIAEVF